MSDFAFVQPPGWKPSRGYSNGVVAPAGARLLFIAGQVAWNAEQRLVGAGDFTAQFRQALMNVITVVVTAGGAAGDLVRLTIYVKDKREYEARVVELGKVWRDLMGRHYPAMSLVQVADLLESGALVEIEGIAALPQ